MNEKIDPDTRSPIVRWSYKRLKKIRACLICYRIMHRRIPEMEREEERERFIERWVVRSFILSIVLFFASFPVGLRWWEWSFLIIALYRVYEVVVWQAWAVLFHGFRLDEEEEPGPLSGRRRIIILLLLNYVEFVFWFAMAYRNLAPLFHGPSLNNPFQALAFALVNSTGVGITSITFQHPVARLITLVQSAIGVFMALVVLARFINLLPPPHEQK